MHLRTLSLLYSLPAVSLKLRSPNRQFVVSSNYDPWNPDNIKQLRPNALYSDNSIGPIREVLLEAKVV